MIEDDYNAIKILDACTNTIKNFQKFIDDLIIFQVLGIKVDVDVVDYIMIFEYLNKYYNLPPLRTAQKVKIKLKYANLNVNRDNQRELDDLIIELGKCAEIIKYYDLLNQLHLVTLNNVVRELV